jgi:hypothetical protein
MFMQWRPFSLKYSVRLSCLLMWRSLHLVAAGDIYTSVYAAHCFALEISCAGDLMLASQSLSERRKHPFRDVSVCLTIVGSQE